jgi:hypothetical protein
VLVQEPLPEVRLVQKVVEKVVVLKQHLRQVLNLHLKHRLVGQKVVKLEEEKLVELSLNSKLLDRS